VSAVLDLTLAINRYDHVRDLVDGTVAVEGVALRSLSFSVEEIFFRFSRFREWDVSEMSLAKYTSLRAGGDDSLIAIRSSRRACSAIRRSSSAATARSPSPGTSPAGASGCRSGRGPPRSTRAGSSPTSAASHWRA